MHPAPARRCLRALMVALTATAVLVPTAAQAAPIDDLVSELNSCSDGSTVVLDQDISAPTTSLPVGCTVTLDLAGYLLQVRNVYINAGRTFTITTNSGGALMADASGAPGTAGIRTTGVTVVTAGGATVYAYGGAGAAGIGGDDQLDAGTFAAQDDSVVDAVGGAYAAGIGGGETGDGATVTLSGAASVTATGGLQGAGIGGGNDGHGATVTVEGTASVSANGGDYGAGIGGGAFGNGGTLTVRDDGVVDATGRMTAAGVGGGFNGSGAVTTTDGSAVLTATGGMHGAGIGGGYFGGSGTTTSNDTSVITATGGINGAGVGGGWASGGGTTTANDSSSITGTGGDYAAGIGGGEGGNGGTTTTNGSATLTGNGGLYAAGVGGGHNGTGGTTRVNDTSLVTATGGTNSVGVGGGENSAGGVVEVHGMLVATGDHSAVGGTTGFGSLIVGNGGLLRLPSGTLTIQDDSGDSLPEVVVEDGGEITGASGGSPTYATVHGPGQIDNGGAITLPTNNLTSPTVAPIHDHHYEITYDANGGTLAPGTTTTRVYAATFDDGDRTLADDPSFPGKTFTGWNTAADGSGTDVDETTAIPGSSTSGAPVSVTLFAQYATDAAPTSPFPLAGVTVEGTPTVGSTVTAQPSTDGGAPSGTSYAYRWLLDGTPISGATERALVLDESMLGHAVSVAVTAVAPGYDAATDTSAPVTVTRGVLTTVAVTVTGEPVVRSTLTAHPTSTPDATYTFQWLADGAPIDGATDETLAVGPGLVGKAVRVVVTASTPGYADTTATSAPVTITAGEMPGTTVTVTGTPQENRMLRAVLDSGRALPAGVTTSYRWYAGTHRIARADGPELLLRAGQVGRRIHVMAVTAAPGYADGTSTSAPTRRVREGRFVTANDLTPQPGSAVRVFGRGPHRATTYVLTIRNDGRQRIRGLVGEDGAFGHRVGFADDACGKVRVRATLKNANGHPIWTRRVRLALPPC